MLIVVQPLSLTEVLRRQSESTGPYHIITLA